MSIRRPPLPSRARRALTCGAVGVALLAAWPAPAQSPDDTRKKLQDVERRLDSKKAESAQQKSRADQLKAELASIAAELVQAAKRVQAQEALVADLERELDRLEAEAQAKVVRLKERRQQFSGVVMALTRIARIPPEAMAAQPGKPEDTVRSALLLRTAVPAIEKRAQSLKRDLDQLARARAEVEAQRAEVTGAMARLKAEEAKIDAMRKQKAALRAEAISKRRAAESQARELAGQADNLRQLLDRLKADRRRREAARRDEIAREQAARAKKPSQLYVEPEGELLRPDVDVAALGGIGSISKARGRLPFPVVGRLVGQYGQAIEDGNMTRKGLSVATRPGAQVIAPFDGEVAFAGPFRGYGQLLIIDHGEGYHSLLAGLGRIDVGLGDAVLAGEPVAVMPTGDGAPGGNDVLYVEFRRDNQPINPLPWLASRKGTPKG